MAVMVDGEVPEEVTPKDLILALISEIGTGGGQGHMVEYRGEAIEKMSMEGRMTICNMSIEWGARVGMGKRRQDPPWLKPLCLLRSHLGSHAQARLGSICR